MRKLTLAIAAATMLGLAAAQAAQPGIQPGAAIHRTPAAHRLLAAADGSGADVVANRHTA